MNVLTLEKALEAVQPTTKQGETPTGKIIKKGRNKMGALLSEHAEELEAMHTKADQIADYGVEMWNHHYVRLASIDELPNATLSGEVLRNEIWKKIPNSKFKRFQEAFCKPEDFIVPRVRAEGAHIVLEQFHHWNNVKGCLVDPDCVPDKLLQDLNIWSDGEKRDDAFLRLQSKYRALPALKKIWESAEPLERNNLRILVVQKPRELLQARYENVPDPSEEIIGSILYSREYENGKKTQGNEKSGRQPFKKLAVSFFSGAYEALRKTSYEQYQYEHAETGKLADLQIDIGTLNQRFDTEWKPKAPNEVKTRLTQEAESLIQRAETLLSSARQKHKQRIYNLLTGIREKLEAKQVGPTMSKMVGASNAIDARFADMASKGSFNNRDASALNRCVEQNERTFKGLRSSVEKGSKRVGINLDVYNESVKPDAKKRTVDAVMRDLRLTKDAFRQPVRPFSTYINAMNIASAEVEAALNRGNQTESISAVVRMHIIGKLQAAHTCIEQLKAEISNLDTVSMSRVRKYSNRISEIFEAREIFPDLVPMHFAVIYEPIEAALKSLRTIVQEAGSDIESDPEAFGKFCDHLREHLDTFKLESATRDLTQAIEAHV